jgi:PhnB protein
MKYATPFLHFNGNCRQAMEFYKQCLGAELFLLPFSEAPGNPAWATPESRDRIMHSSLNVGGTGVLMASDTMAGTPFERGQHNFAVCLECETFEEIDTLFTTLSESGNVTMPLQDTFWNARFGMFTDKFGIHWMLNYTLPKPA